MSFGSILYYLVVFYIVANVVMSSTLTQTAPYMVNQVSVLSRLNKCISYSRRHLANI